MEVYGVEMVLGSWESRVLWGLRGSKGSENLEMEGARSRWGFRRWLGQRDGEDLKVAEVLEEGEGFLGVAVVKWLGLGKLGF